MEIRETHIAIHSENERWGLGESHWESTGTKTFGEEYQRIMRDGLYDPEKGILVTPRCTGRMYRDTRVGAVRVGWVFVFRTGNQDYPSYLREVWVEARPE